jgi:hypothetical protein
VPTDPTATLDPEQDPETDTLSDTAEDTAEDTQGTTVDWETRYKQEQIHISRQAAEIKTLKAQLAEPAEVDDDDDEPDEPEEPDGSARLERDSWRLAEKEYGRASITAYTKAARLLDRASTPSDYVAAFEAYHAARLEYELKRFAKEAEGAAPERPTQPPIESNRPDVGPRNNLDREAEAALAKGDSRGFLLAQVRKIRGD